MEKLPAEIVENILDRLPMEKALQLVQVPDETALRAKQVCKAWRSILRRKTDKVGFLFTSSQHDGLFGTLNYRLYYGDEYDPRSKMNYTSRYAFDDKIDNLNSVPWGEYLDGMLGSCNGLVCFQRQRPYLGNPFLICNPFTAEVVYIPKANTYQWEFSPEDSSWHISGFGYCHSTNEYKIVRMYYYRGQARKAHCQVYTVGGGGGGGRWRNSGSIRISPPLYSAGIYANGALHWLHRSYSSIYPDDYTVTAFDLEDEKFQFIPLPRFQGVTHMHRPKLLGGENLYLVYTTLDKPYCTDIWAYKRKSTNTINGCDIKENYNDKNSWHWIKEFRIEWEERYWKDLEFFEPMAITRSGELLLRRKFNDDKTAHYCYDLKTNTMSKICDGYHMINVTPHANTFVSISLKDQRDPRSSVRRPLSSWMSQLLWRRPWKSSKSF